MNNPGCIPLFVGNITTEIDRATGAQAWSPVDLSGMMAATLLANFKYGSGGATCFGIIQAGASCDASIALDMAQFDFTTASDFQWCNNEGLLSAAVAHYADLASSGRLDGLLLDRMRALLIVGATPYVNTTLSLIACPR